MEDASAVLSSFNPRQKRMLRHLTEGSEPILNELLEDLNGSTEPRTPQESQKTSGTESTEQWSQAELELAQSTGLTPQEASAILDEARRDLKSQSRSSSLFIRLIRNRVVSFTDSCKPQACPNSFHLKVRPHKIPEDGQQL